jgi:hypothetical protein
MKSSGFWIPGQEDCECGSLPVKVIQASHTPQLRFHTAELR